MRKALAALSFLLLIGVFAAVYFWPAPPESEPPAVAAPASEGENAESCDSCTLRHQRLTKPDAEQGG